MTCKEFEIQVQDNHLSRTAQTPKPILVLSELIWNAVDAEATHVDVTLIKDDLDGLVAIEVPNNRHGTPWTKRRIWSRGWVVHGNNRALQQGRLHSPRQGRAQVASPAELHTLPGRRLASAGGDRRTSCQDGDPPRRGLWSIEGARSGKSPR